MSFGSFATTNRVYFMDFWGLLKGKHINFPAAATDRDIGDIVVSGLPTDCTIIRVEVMLCFAAMRNGRADVNALGGTQQLRIKKSTGTWDVDDLDGIYFLANDLYMLEASSQAGGACLHGNADVKAEVDGNATYNVQLEDAKAVAADMSLYNAHAGLRVFFK